RRPTPSSTPTSSRPTRRPDPRSFPDVKVFIVSARDRGAVPHRARNRWMWTGRWGLGPGPRAWIAWCGCPWVGRCRARGPWGWIGLRAFLSTCTDWLVTSPGVPLSCVEGATAIVVPPELVPALVAPGLGLAAAGSWRFQGMLSWPIVIVVVC